MADVERIVGGPNKWGLIIDSFARRGEKGAYVLFQTEERERAVTITGLHSGQYCANAFDPHPHLGIREMEQSLGVEFDWDNAWWFLGHGGTRALPVWGIYSAKTRQGILATDYIGNGGQVEKPSP